MGRYIREEHEAELAQVRIKKQVNNYAGENSQNEVITFMLAISRIQNLTDVVNLVVNYKRAQVLQCLATDPNRSCGHDFELQRYILRTTKVHSLLCNFE